MHHHDLEHACMPQHATTAEAVRRLDSAGIGIVLVTDPDRRLLGTITDGDIRRALLAGPTAGSNLSAILASPLSDFLASKNNPVYPRPVCLPDTADDDRVLRVMIERRIRHLPLLDDAGRVTGLARIEDLLPDRARPEPEPLTAVVMAGGIGSRLRPLTADTPKPMLPVGGRPLLERTIERLRDAGVRDVVLSTRYKSEKLVEHFHDGSRFGVCVSYITENRPLGTAGSLRLMQRPESTLLVINGDVLTAVDFNAMRDFHEEHRATLTIGVREYTFSVPYGVVDCDGARVAALREKPEYTSFVNAGVYLLEPDAFDCFPETGQPFNMTDLIERLLADRRTVVSFPIHEYWMDIGQHDDYDRAQRDAAAGLAG